MTARKPPPHTRKPVFCQISGTVQHEAWIVRGSTAPATPGGTAQHYVYAAHDGAWLTVCAYHSGLCHEDCWKADKYPDLRARIAQPGGLVGIPDLHGRRARVHRTVTKTRPTAEWTGSCAWEGVITDGTRLRGGAVNGVCLRTATEHTWIDISTDRDSGDGRRWTTTVTLLTEES